MFKRTIRLSPAEYINEAGVLKTLPQILIDHKYKRTVILTDKIVKDVIKKYLPQDFLKTNQVEIFNGNATYQEIRRLSLLFKGSDSLIAFGGGQLLDTAKVVADNLKISLINVPTLPSNCAAVTTKSVIYSEDTLEMIGGHRQNQASNMVLVEPDLLKNAPYEYILSGIGDTLAKFYEIRLRLTDKKMNLVTAKIGRSYLEICREEMLKVTKISELTDRELINFLDTIILVAASVDGIADFDGRSALAHAFYNAFIKFQNGSKKTHGEIVALGILFQLYIEKNKSDYLSELIDYYTIVGLPVNLSDINWNVEDLSGFVDYIIRPDDIRVQSLFPKISSEDVLAALKELGEGR